MITMSSACDLNHPRRCRGGSGLKVVNEVAYSWDVGTYWTQGLNEESQVVPGGQAGAVGWVVVPFSEMGNQGGGGDEGMGWGKMRNSNCVLDFELVLYKA